MYPWQVRELQDYIDYVEDMIEQNNVPMFLSEWKRLNTAAIEAQGGRVLWR